MMFGQCVGLRRFATGMQKTRLSSVPQFTEEMLNLLILPEFTLTRTEN